MATEISASPPLRRALSWPFARRSLGVAAVVGTLLNAINQGDALFSGGGIDWLKLGLTYCVPFLVATYGAYSALRALDATRR
ncbi:MAG: nitrate/nitrite transporter NrtS [Rhodospirillales bacterium]|nr:MAG: nitrate/nitrite transporter NrtS [Rhodospirillales bacterium]